MTRTDDGVSLGTFGGAVVAEASYVEQEIEPVEAVSWDGGEHGQRVVPGPRAPTRSRPASSAAPSATTGCGSSPARSPPAQRAAGPGWRRPGRRTRRSRPTGTSTTTSRRRACLASTWAALDCAGGWAGDLTERLMVLGTMTAIVDDLPVVGEPHVVTAEHRGGEGRRTFTASTLHDADGRIVGRAEHTWVARRPGPLQRLRSRLSAPAPPAWRCSAPGHATKSLSSSVSSPRAGRWTSARRCSA